MPDKKKYIKYKVIMNGGIFYSDTLSGAKNFMKLQKKLDPDFKMTLEENERYLMKNKEIGDMVMSNKEIKEFKQELLEQRLKLGLNQKQFAEKVGLQRTCISMYESGARKPSKLVISKLESILNCEFSYKKLNASDIYKQLRQKEQECEVQTNLAKINNDVIVKLQSKNTALQKQVDRMKSSLEKIREIELQELDIDWDEYEAGCRETDYSSIITYCEIGLGETEE
ncbi:MAG: helix-turn-helix transcriptional regulator [Candidatus Gastranaerophilaceae bacterium]